MDKKRSRSESKDEKSEEEVKNMENRQQLAHKAAKKRHKKTSVDDYLYHIVIVVFLATVGYAIYNNVVKDKRKLYQIQVIESKVINEHNDLTENSFSLSENDFFVDWNLQDAKKLFQSHLTMKKSLQKCKSESDTSVVPDRYNFRESNQECNNDIFSTNQCSCSYISSTLSSIQDRHCKLNNERVSLSVQQLLNCNTESKGCEGGSVTQVLDWIKTNGVVEQSCLQYQGQKTECPNTLDKCRSINILDYCVVQGHENVKREILKNGPVVSSMVVYRDFLLYKSGVFKPVPGIQKFQGKHLVKIIGWDKTDNNIPYWIIESNWGTTWGEDGLAKLSMYSQDLKVEEFVIAPILNVPDQKDNKDDEQSI